MARRCGSNAVPGPGGPGGGDGAGGATTSGPGPGSSSSTGDFDVKKVHHNGSYVLPMPEGYDLKKILTRMIRRSGVRVSKMM